MDYRRGMTTQTHLVEALTGRMLEIAYWRVNVWYVTDSDIILMVEFKIRIKVPMVHTHSSSLDRHLGFVDPGSWNCPLPHGSWPAGNGTDLVSRGRWVPRIFPYLD